MDLALTRQTTIDPSKHALRVKVRPSLFAEAIKNGQIQYLRFHNIGLGEQKLVLKEFSLSASPLDDESIPVYINVESQPPHHSSIFTFNSYFVAHTLTNTVTLNVTRDIIKFKASAVEKVKMGQNLKLQ